jgi:hypothetical protein
VERLVTQFVGLDGRDPLLGEAVQEFMVREA